MWWFEASLIYRSEKTKVFVAQLCQAVCDPMDCSLPGSSIYGTLQAGILEWVAILFSRGSSQPRDCTWVFWTTDIFFTIWATREAQRSEIKSSVKRTCSVSESYYRAQEGPMPPSGLLESIIPPFLLLFSGRDLWLQGLAVFPQDHQLSQTHWQLVPCQMVLLPTQAHKGSPPGSSVQLKAGCLYKRICHSPVTLNLSFQMELKNPAPAFMVVRRVGASSGKNSLLFVSLYTYLQGDPTSPS